MLLLLYFLLYFLLSFYFTFYFTFKLYPNPVHSVCSAVDGDDDDYFEEDDMFSRLEESRVRLEKELGCDVFLNAYKTVQVRHLYSIVHHGRAHYLPY